MLQKDPNNPQNNRGYCFFEYVDERATEKAIKHLSNIEFKEKKLKVQRKSQGQKISVQDQIKNMHVSITEEEKMNIPLFAINPSRVVQFMNMIALADLFDEKEIYRVKDDLISECQQHGEILALEILHLRPQRDLGAERTNTCIYTLPLLVSAKAVGRLY